MGGLLTHPCPQPARHPSPVAILAGLDVMEVRHGLVEDGAADSAGRVFGSQHDDARAFEPGAPGPSGEVGREPFRDVPRGSISTGRSGSTLIFPSPESAS